MLLSTPVRDVSQFGPHIYKYCQHLETLRLAHDTEPNGKNVLCFGLRADCPVFLPVKLVCTLQFVTFVWFEMRV